ncbi:hypothetical protein ACFLY9_00325 [Patescibacteria group bacterium]
MNFVNASNLVWTQSDWSGGEGESTVNQYFNTTNIDSSSISSQLSLVKDEKFTNRGSDIDADDWLTGAEPDSILGLLLWLKADGIPGVQNYDLIQTWPDSSINGNDAVQNTANLRPQYYENIINSKPVIRFDGTGNEDWMNVGSVRVSTGPVRTFIVSQAPVSAGFKWQRIISSWDGITADDYIAPSWMINAPWYGDGTPKVYGPDIRTFSADSGRVIDNVKIGHGGVNNQFYNGYIAEIIIFGNVLTDYERGQIENYLRDKYLVSTNYGISSKVTDTSTTYSNSQSSIKLIANQNGELYQSINIGNTQTYSLEAYAYTDGTAVTSGDVELYYNDSTITTTYTDMSSGWYLLSSEVTGANADRDYGVQIKAGKTVYLDDMSLFQYKPSGTLTSGIYDTQQNSEWGYVNWTENGIGGTLQVKIRTSNDSNMIGSTSFESCDYVTNGSDITSNNCVSDGDRYVQYLVEMTEGSSPILQDISIQYGLLPETGQNIFSPVVIGTVLMVSAISGFVIFLVSVKKRSRK